MNLQKTYGHWTVLTPPGNHRAHDKIQCICQCGTQRAIPKHKLTTGRTKSCGCHSHDRLTGKHWPTLQTDTHATPGAQFGRWTVLSQPQPGHNRTVTCQCQCGTTRNVAITQLENGRTKSCGCYRKDGASSLHK